MRDSKTLIAPLAGLVVLALVVQQVIGGLRASGAWRHPASTGGVRPEDPYARLDQILARQPTEVPSGGLRDPFSFGASRPAPAPAQAPQRAWTPPPPPRPVLTSIIWDADPRATIRYRDQDFSVRENSLFADFRVRSISSTEVVLERGGEPLVLSLRSKGD